VWVDATRAPESLGRPEHRHVLKPGTRMIESSVLSFPEAPGGGFDVNVTHLTHVHIAVGTGYGLDDDWRHGMYQGPLVVQGVVRGMDELDKFGWYAVVDHVARFEIEGGPHGGQVGYGLHEHGFFGPFRKYGLERYDDGA
jgi:hypothetical protein